MTDIESFLTDWMERLERLNLQPMTADALVRGRLRELEQEKTQWESKRKRELQEIHEKAEELSKAWLRLEQEQRRFLQTRDSQWHNSRPLADDAVEQDAPESCDMELASQTVCAVATGGPEEPKPRRPSPIHTHRTRTSAIRQFEQLRREIESSRQPNRTV
jgi:hypothetical protein